MRIFKKIIIWVVILSAIAFGAYKIINAPQVPEEEIASRNGLHWHSHISIFIKGEQVMIPADIGISGPMGAGGDPMELHTHGVDGIVHAEFAGLVKRDQLKIGKFFEIWGKDFSKDGILGNRTGEGGAVRMFVNGEENFDYENYEITGKGPYKYGSESIDDIVIKFE